MPIAERLIPSDIAADLVLGTEGPEGGGIRFLFRLAYRDETRTPPAAEVFEHRWVVSRVKLDQAEREGRIDDWLLRIQSRQEQRFLRHLERQLRRNRTYLVRVGTELVLRPAEPWMMRLRP